MSDETATEQAATRRTKRRYAHELYPHAEEYETRPLAVEVPYLYAQAAGLQTHGTSWFDLREGEELKLSVARTVEMAQTRHMAFLADALLQGMTGNEAWAWADERAWDYSGEWLYERAAKYGVDPDQIKPYPCGPEPDHHDHLGEVGAKYVGMHLVTRIDGKESECAECTEEIPAEVAS